MPKTLLRAFERVMGLLLAAITVDARRDQLLARMLREARDLDVWHFVRPIEVARVLERLRLGHSTC